MSDLIPFLNVYGLSFLNSIPIDMYTTSTSFHFLPTFFFFRLAFLYLPSFHFSSPCIRCLLESIYLFIYSSTHTPYTHPSTYSSTPSSTHSSNYPSVHQSCLPLICKSISRHVHVAGRNLRSAETSASLTHQVTLPPFAIISAYSLLH